MFNIFTLIILCHLTDIMELKVYDASASLVGGMNDQHDGVEFVEIVCPNLLSTQPLTQINETSHYLRLTPSKSSFNYIFPLRLRLNLSDPQGKSYFEPSNHVDFGVINITQKEIVITNPKVFFFDANILRTRFSIDNRKYIIFPADFNISYEVFENKNCSEGNIVPHVLQMLTILDIIDPVIARDSGIYTRDNPLLDKPYLIEAALFIDEYDLHTVNDTFIISIGKQVEKIFESLQSINLRFKLVGWYSYPAQLIINETMISNQRTFESYLADLEFRKQFDAGMLLSSRIIERVKEGYVVGWANVGTMCRKNLSALVVWYKPATVAWFLAHELVHLLNSYHDQEKECEKGTQLPDQPYIDSNKNVHWSNCTIKVIADWIKKGKLDCLLTTNNNQF